MRMSDPVNAQLGVSFIVKVNLLRSCFSWANSSLLVRGATQ